MNDKDASFYKLRKVHKSKNQSNKELKIKKDKNNFNKTFFINPIKKLQYLEKSNYDLNKNKHNYDSKSLFRKLTDSSFNSTFSDTQVLNTLLKKLKSLNDKNLEELIKNIITIKAVFKKTFHIYRINNCYNESQINLIVKNIKCSILVNFKEKLIDSNPVDYLSRYYSYTNSKYNLIANFKDSIQKNMNIKSIPKYRINSDIFAYLNSNNVSKQKLIVRNFEDAIVKKKINFQNKTKTFYWEEDSSSFECIIKEDSLLKDNFNKMNSNNPENEYIQNYNEENNLRKQNSFIIDDIIVKQSYNDNYNYRELDVIENLCSLIEKFEKNDKIEINGIIQKTNLLYESNLPQDTRNKNYQENKNDYENESNIRIYHEKEEELIDAKKSIQNKSLSISSYKDISIKKEEHKVLKKENETSNNFKKIKVFQSKSNILKNTNEIKYKNDKLSERLKKPIFSVNFPVIIQKNIINSQYIKHDNIKPNANKTEKKEIKKILNEKNVRRIPLKETSKYFLINSLNITRSKLMKSKEKIIIKSSI